MHHVWIFVNKTSLMQFCLGIYCILFSSTCFGCYVHPSTGAQLCTGRKVQYMCACSVSFGVEFQLKKYIYIIWKLSIWKVYPVSFNISTTHTCPALLVFSVLLILQLTILPSLHRSFSESICHFFFNVVVTRHITYVIAYQNASCQSKRMTTVNHWWIMWHLEPLRNLQLANLSCTLASNVMVAFVIVSSFVFLPLSGAW